MPSPFRIQNLDSLGAINRSRGHLDETIENVAIAGEGTAKDFLGLIIPRSRFRFGMVLLFLAFFGLAGRAYYLQGYNGVSYRAVADANQFRRVTIIPSRGRIFDARGTQLATNVSSFVVTMTIADLPQEQAERQEVLHRVADLSGLQPTDLDLLITKYASTPFERIPVKSGLSHEAAMKTAIEINELAGFHLDISSERFYATSAPSLSHILGYTGSISTQEMETRSQQQYGARDKIGKAGVEKSAETLLRGTPGVVVEEVDARGRRRKTVSQADAVSGQDITLTIDAAFQKVVEASLARALQQAGARRGSAVVLDPASGAVLALVSLPAFDSNAFARGITTREYTGLIEDPSQPLFPRAVAGEFASGSTFKPFVAYGGLKEGIINEHTTFSSTGGIAIGPWFFPDWKAGGHGYTDVRKAIAESVNTFFYLVGGGNESVPGLGVQKITQYAQQFGFGSKTGIDLPSEASGFLPSKEWKEQAKGEPWYVGDTYHYAIGQGDVLVTPVQMASATAVLANGGTRMVPHVIGATDGKEQTIQTISSESLSSSHLKTVREGMRQAVTSGSARLLQSLAYPVAGKTGTAQIGADKNTHAWFAGFGPYTDSALAVAILIEEGGAGDRVAVPVARDIFQWWFANRMQD